MTSISIYGGPLKRVLIERAFGLCGQSITEYELTTEEYKLGLVAADQLAATLGPGLGWNSPYELGDGSPEDESGLKEGDVFGFVVLLTQDIAQNIGKQWSANKTQAGARDALVARYQIIPQMALGRATIRGAGASRFGRWRGPFFCTPRSDDEIAQ